MAEYTMAVKCLAGEVVYRPSCDCRHKLRRYQQEFAVQVKEIESAIEIMNGLMEYQENSAQRSRFEELAETWLYDRMKIMHARVESTNRREKQ